MRPTAASLEAAATASALACRLVQPAAAGIGWNFREWFVPKSLQRYNLSA